MENPANTKPFALYHSPATNGTFAGQFNSILTATQLNQIYQCFLDYIGQEETWGLPDRWINSMHELRSQLAHGGRTIDIHTIEEVSEDNVTLKNQANLLLQRICDRLDH